MQFIFINVKKPEEALQLAKEPEIRSYVTRYQWRQFERQGGRLKKKPSSVSQRINTGECPDNTDYQGIHPCLASIMRQIGGLRMDPFQSYPLSGRPWIPRIVDHYLIHMAVDIPELDLPGNHGLLRTSWFPLVISEPALFSVIALLAASHFASMYENGGHIRLDLIKHRCEAVTLINRSLELQQVHALSDALIGAIAKLASYEAMFGSLQNYNIHMRGLVQVISLRGGLASLGLSGLLRRIVIWIDRNAAFLHGSPMYFPDSTFVPGEPLPDPNPGHFLGAS